MPDPIGAMRERIVVQSFTDTPDAEGQPIRTWSTFTTLWARNTFLSGKELEGMQKINEQVQARFIVRYRTDLTELMRVTWRGSTWNIHAFLPTEDKFFMSLLVSRIE